MGSASQELVSIEERTAPGAGGVSVLDLQGTGAFGLLANWGVEDLRVGELRFARLRLQGEVMDEVLLCVHSAESVELHVHGSPPLVRRLLREAPATAPTLASETFEQRVQRALAHAPCELAARVLLDQAEGAWECECRALLACNVEQLELGIAQWTERSRDLRRALEPARVLVAGPVNAGKSTLFNALVGAQRVITSDQAGTTRDLVSERAQLGLWPIELIDSAGLRAELADDAAGRVERAGQSLAREGLESADWVLWLVPPGNTGQQLPGVPAQVTRLASCNDLPGGEPGGISVLADPAAAVRRVSELFHAALQLPLRVDVSGQAIAFDGASRAWLDALRQADAEQQRRRLEAFVGGD